MQNYLDHPAEFPMGALPLVVLGTFMVVVDFFVVNVAIPPLQADLGASPAAVQFVIAGYGVTYGSGLILSARLGDRFGRRRIYLMGFALFTVASAACGLAPNPATLIAARLVQGVGASLLSPQVLALVGDLYTTPARRARAFTGYGLSMGLAAVLGQLVGGLLTQADIAGLGWRWCFLVNIPIGLIALPLIRRIIPESRGAGRRLDVAGAITVTAAVVALILPLIAGRELGWPAWSIAVLIAFVPLLVGFLVQQRRRDEPLVDLGLFRQRGIRVGIASVLVFYVGVASFFLVFALYLQGSMHLTPLDSGLLFVAIGAGFLATSVVSARVHAALGDLALAAGAVAMIAGLTALVWASSGDLVSAGRAVAVAVAIFVYGAGQGLVLAPLNASVLARVPARLAGTGAGLVTTMMQVGNALGVAVIGLVFFGPTGDTHDPATTVARFDRSALLLIALLVLFAVLTVVLHVGRRRDSGAAGARPGRRAGGDLVTAGQ